MVEDYHNRKMAKKKRKREGQDERPEGKRIRSKKNKTRRICRGLCYQDPFEVRRKGQAPADVQDAAVEKGAVEDSAAPPKPKRRRKQKPDSSVKQSTSINLLAFSQHDGTNSANPCVGAAEALLAYPQATQQYMLDQGLTGPTPVQERYMLAKQCPLQVITYTAPLRPPQLVQTIFDSCLTAGLGQCAMKAKMCRELQSQAVAKLWHICCQAYL